MAIEYDLRTGTTGFMRLVDTGSTVEFWLKSGQPTTYFGSATFSYSSPHGDGTFSHGYTAGDTWQMMGSIPATRDGVYSWSIPNTGTEGFGGPTTQSVTIGRATVPPAPTEVSFSRITTNSLRTTFSSRGNGGSPITQWRIAFGTNPDGPNASGNTISSSTGTKDFGNLEPGKTYYAWAQGVNAVGEGAWSPRTDAKTLSGAMIRHNGVWVSAVPYVKVNGVWQPAVPYVKKNGAWVLPTS